MLKVRSKSGQPRRALVAAMSAACLSATCGTVAAPVTGSPAVETTVADAPARSLGEPAAAQDSTVGAVVATRFGASGAKVQAWTRPRRSGNWSSAGSVLPSGFGSSYDAAAAAAPGGPALVVVGASPAGNGCIQSGSVAIADVRSDGRLSPARLVSDQRGTGSFDDRPAVAAGPGGTVWVAWSQGPDADACEDVGKDDRLEMAVSRDGGQTFGAPIALPADGGNSAFGARLAPLPGGGVAVSWTEQFGRDRQSVMVSVLGAAGHPSPPRRVLTATPPPLGLPAASFYDFPAGDIVALPGGSLVVAAPLWRSGRAMIGLAAGTPAGPWRGSDVRAPRGADLLLPALADVAAGTVRLLCAVHTRSGDRLGYDWTDLRATAAPEGAPAAPAPESGLRPLTPAPNGPGFFEIGEELSVARVPGGLLAPVVVAGSSGARLETLSWRQANKPVPRRTAATPAPAASKTQAGRHSATTASVPWIALWTVAVLAAIAAGLSAWRFRRRGDGGGQGSGRDS